MKLHLQTLRPMLAVFLLAALLLTPALAAGGEMGAEEVYCFASSDFSEAALDGIVLTGLPDETVGRVLLGRRVLQKGDVLAGESLEELTLESVGDGGAQATLTYLPVSGGTLLDSRQMTVYIRSKKNDPPSLNDQSLETYRDIALSGVCCGEDPEGEALTYSVSTAPRRGTVELKEDGSFVYTPKENKVGRDSFGVTAADPAGNVSQEATVTIQILRPSSRTSYADMAGDPDEFVALWLREQEVFYGQQISTVTVFGPEEAVTRGEFLVMTMDALDIVPETEDLSTGFADELQTPVWMRPYVAQALRSGIISGVKSQEGLVFLPDAELTRAEAAVIVNGILGLSADKTGDTVEVFAAAVEDSLPAWAAGDLRALEENELMTLDRPEAVLTRRETARLLYRAAALAGRDSYQGTLLAWAAE